MHTYRIFRLFILGNKQGSLRRNRIEENAAKVKNQKIVFHLSFSFFFFFSYEHVKSRPNIRVYAFARWNRY